MVKPTFLCIGVQKAGTTSLINYLSQHPHIYMNDNEMHFFDVDKNYTITTDDIKRYENSFKTNKRNVGEKTPSYSYLPFAIDRIHNYYPDVKLILFLREPISRAYSQYNMILNFKNLTLDDISDEQILLDFENEPILEFSQLTNNNPDGNFIIRGFYDEIIKYILIKFNRDNLYIGIAEEILKDKFVEYNKIIKFLGCDEMSDIQINDTNIREYKKTIPKKLEQKLYNIYKDHNEKLYELLGRKINIWEGYYNTIRNKIDDNA